MDKDEEIKMVLKNSSKKAIKTKAIGFDIMFFKDTEDDDEFGKAIKDAENITVPGDFSDILGDTKEEAIQTLIARYKKNSILKIEPFDKSKVKPNIYNTHAEYEGGLQISVKLPEEKKIVYNEIMHLILNIRPYKKYWKKDEAFEKQNEFWKNYYPIKDKIKQNIKAYLNAIEKLEDIKYGYEVTLDPYQKIFAKQNLPLINQILERDKKVGLKLMFEDLLDKINKEESKLSEKLREINDKYKKEYNPGLTDDELRGYGRGAGKNNWTGD